jgi:hypothetical protein
MKKEGLSKFAKKKFKWLYMWKFNKYNSC